MQKKKSAADSIFHVWETQKIARLPGSLLEPLIPCNSLAFSNLNTERTYRSGKGYQPASSSFVARNQSISSLSEEKHQIASSLSSEQNQTAPLLFEEQNKTAPLLSEEQNQTTPSFPEEQNHTDLLIEEHTETASSLAEQQNQVSPSLAEERCPTAPSSSVHLTFVGCPELREVHGLEILEPGTPVESMEKYRSPSDDEPLEFDLTDEEINSYEGDGNEKSHLSVRTRKVAGYLYQRFADKNRVGDELIKLSRIVKGKTKKESATLFYEILVLKTKDYIDVRQKNAYEDIQVMQTPALKNALKV